ncbi:molybdopterin molybdotransferase MoeA [Novosphingobium album (ex Liu et al. 2023)]|uniref:Molybdopterin molybdenumtransferase n=1 Tax=Novosphingobium album (ex Liu et al. 2023) TaxID=3031130 RepID=A0ABT5WWA7_9SPHN|nr:molybdopterin molybdotransferase MoeA [Novosphingobium album (ex Liu et al. 2023)]MDE8654189.1 molybdopterin molybdotransferase MoeA [Novosphingobium album (ex Liu et al. 2023)]
MSKPVPIPLEDAQARLLQLAGPLPVERVDVEGAIGRYLAEPIAARRTQPAADLSAMDGYAVAADDLAGPWQVVGESAAGHPFGGRLAAGQAVRIATGAIVPADAQAIILQEDIARQGDSLRLTGDPPVPPHKHIRPMGVDFAVGGQVLAAGVKLGPAQGALAISAGHKHVPVRAMPKVAVIDSGDELAAEPDCCAPHQIPASNGAMLAAMARTLPCRVTRIGPVADTMEALAAALDAARDADVVVTSGGASVGDHDLIKPALAAWGAEIDFWRVAIKPGKPILVATREQAGRRQIVLGLPGNPVSSHVTAYFFMLPLLRTLLGAARPLPLRFRVRLAAPIKANGARREFPRGTWDGEAVLPHSLQDSAALAALSASNVLIDRPAHAPRAEAGEEVHAFLLENGGLA